MNTSVTGRACDSGISSGLFNLSYAIEGATSLFGSVDGYSKLINADNLTQQAETDYADAANVTQLESILSQIYAIAHTSYTEARMGAGESSQITKLMYPHAFRISVSWTWVTTLAFVIAVLIFLATTGQMILWLIAVTSLQDQRPELELLEPLDLMAYTIGGAGWLEALLSTKAARRKLVGERHGLVLEPYTDNQESIDYGGLVR